MVRAVVARSYWLGEAFHEQVSRGVPSVPESERDEVLSIASRILHISSPTVQEVQVYLLRTTQRQLRSSGDG